MTNPSLLIHHFAAALGWHGIERTDITLSAEICGNVPAGTVVTCWSTNDLRFFIQINQTAPGRFGAYNVSVIAERYNIAPLDFASCEFKTIEEAHAEAQRLSPLFARTNFRDKRWRRRYLEEFPQKLLHRKKKWRGWKGYLHAEQTDERDPE